MRIILAILNFLARSTNKDVAYPAISTNDLMKSAVAQAKEDGYLK